MARRNHRSSHSGQNSIIRYIAVGTLGVLTLALVAFLLALPAADPALAQDPPANSAPAFPGDTADRSIAEHSPAGQSIGAPVTAADADGDTLTYALAGTDAGSFDLDPDTGQLSVKNALDYESKSSYSVAVTVSDGKNADGEADASLDDAIAVSIAVVNMDEPGRISFNSATPQVGTPLTAILTDPDGNLRNDIWVWERSANRSSWDAIENHALATYTPSDADAGQYLRAAVSYQDGQGDGTVKVASWTEVSNPVPAPAAPEPTPAPTPTPTPEPTPTPTPTPAPPANNEPQFASASDVRYVAENTPAGTGIGSPVTATDADGDTLSYRLTGNDAGSFAFNGSTGQISVRNALDYESRASYSVTVTVSDGKNTAGEQDASVDDSIAITIAVTNVDEPGVVSLDTNTPEVGKAVRTVLLDPDGGVSGVSWAWARSSNGTAWSAIAGATSSAYTPTDDDDGMYLRASASYTDPEGPGKTAQAVTSNPAQRAPEPAPATTPTPTPQPTPAPTSEPTPAPPANNEPQFANASDVRYVAENTPAGTGIGSPVTATDGDGDTLAYGLTGNDAGSFDFNGATGQISVKGALDYESRASYSVTVTVSDGKNTAGEADATVDDSIAITISVTNVDEAGVVSLDTNTPEVGEAVRTVLLDPDGVVSGVVWAWARSSNGTNWTAIAGATSSAYTPTDDDDGMYLRASASYTDPEGPGKTAQAVTGSAVTLPPRLVTPDPITLPSTTASDHQHAVPQNWSLIPSGLGPGDSFRLLFITSNSTRPASSDIGTYNTAIQARAAANSAIAGVTGLSAKFRAVISTQTVDARDNTGTAPADTSAGYSSGEGVRIYWVESGTVDEKVADDYADFYDGSWDPNHQSGGTGYIYGRNEYGAYSERKTVWTGSNDDGTKHATKYAGQQFVQAGMVNGPSNTLHSNKPFSQGSVNSVSTNGHFYGLSPVLTVAVPPPPKPITVPEDWSLIPSGLGPGESFRLLFISSTGMNPSSNDIETYNKHVQGRAAANSAIAGVTGLSGEFRAVISTRGVEARDNTDTRYTGDTTPGTDDDADLGVPIYWVESPTVDEKVADDYKDFYDDSWDSNAVDTANVARLYGRNEAGTRPTGRTWVWTGSNANGTKHATNYAGAGSVMRGVIEGPLTIPNASAKPIALTAELRTDFTTNPLYGLSPVLTVAVPPPPKPITVPDNWSLIPSGFGPGESFRLLFATAPTPATSSDINTYNSFVQGQAAGSSAIAGVRGLSAEFRAVISTRGVDARDNTGTAPANGSSYTSGEGVPIYWVESPTVDEKVADDYPDFYDDSWDFNNSDGDAVHGRNRDGNHLGSRRYVWTGSNADGTKHAIGYIAGIRDVRVGHIDGPSSPDRKWSPLSVGFLRATASETKPIYALSPVLTVEDKVRPARPTNLQTYLSDGAVFLSWDNPSDSTITKYQYRQNSGSWTDIPDSGKDTVTHVVSGLDNGRRYTFQIRAVDTGGAGPVASVSATPDTVDVEPNWALTPSGLDVGDSFRLLFFTSTNQEPTSEDIADYNTTVQERAATNSAIAKVSGLSGQFRAIISTATVDARDNTATTYTDADKGVPIYWVKSPTVDEKVADDYEDFYDGSWDFTNDDGDAVQGRDESGNRSANARRTVWTGSKEDGTKHPTFYAGKPRSGDIDVVGVIYGIINIQAEVENIKPLSFVHERGSTLGSGYYGLSPVLTVVDKVRPARPTNLQAYPSSGAVLLSWDDPADTTITRYEYWQSGGDWVTIEGSGKATVTHVVSGLDNGRRYTFRVRAVDTGGAGPVASVSATPDTVDVEPDWALTPSGLDVGDSFRLLFVTSNSTRQVSSSDIGTYNAAVQARAGANSVISGVTGLSAKFRAVISTGTVDARDNTVTRFTGDTTTVTTDDSDTGVPIYWVESGTVDEKVADDYADFYDDSWDFNSGTGGTAVYGRDELGNYTGRVNVWTGSNANGTKHATHHAGHASLVRFGLVNGPNSLPWDYKPISESALLVASNDGHYYGLSPVLTVHDTVRPARPTGLQGVAGHTWVTLSWDDPSDPTITTYQYRLGGGAWIDIPNSDSTTTSHTVTGLRSGTTYTFGLRAVDTGGPGAAWNPLRVRTPRAQTVPADWSLIPAGLGPGDTFRLLFASRNLGNMVPMTPHIEEYNDDVQTLAARNGAIAKVSGLSGQFRALMSTATVDARDNTYTTYIDANKGVPIYWLGGESVANDYEDFYDGSWHKHDLGIHVKTDGTTKKRTPYVYGRDENGNLIQGGTWVWTGSDANGTKHSNCAGCRTGTVRQGWVNGRSLWAHDNATISHHDETVSNAGRAFYGLSPVFIVGSR